MANGRLGAVDLSANVDTTVFTVTSATVASFSISLCNRNASSARVRLALSASATPSAADYLEYETTLPAYGVLERSGLVLDGGKYLIARSDTANVNCVAYGYEDTV